MKSPQKKRRSRRPVFLYLVLCVCILAIGYSAYRLILTRLAYDADDNLYAELRTELAGPGGSAVPAASQGGAASDGAVSGESAAGEPAAGAPVPADDKTPAAAESQMDFEKLLNINPDTVAWITLPDTVIDYPVVQGEDDSYYLRHLFTGKRGASGCIFMDAANAPDFTDRNTVLYGHHMKNGSMFAGLEKFNKQSYYDAHGSMTLFTPSGDHRVEWFAGYGTTSDRVPTAFESDQAFSDFVAEAAANSDFASDVQVLPTDRLLTLSTCTYFMYDARYLLIGVIR